MKLLSDCRARRCGSESAQDVSNGANYAYLRALVAAAPDDAVDDCTGGLDRSLLSRGGVDAVEEGGLLGHARIDGRRRDAAPSDRRGLRRAPQEARLREGADGPEFEAFAMRELADAPAVTSRLQKLVQRVQKDHVTTV